MKIVNAMILREEGFFSPGEIEIDGARFGSISYGEDLPFKNVASYIDNKPDRKIMPPGAESVAIRHTTKKGDMTIDAGGCHAIPGLIDIHLHGCCGYNFYDAGSAGLLKMLRYQAANGVTAVCPTTLKLPEDALTYACETISSFSGDVRADIAKAPGERPEDAPIASAAYPCGVYLEGPFISKSKAGAQNPDYAATPDIAMIRRLQAASGNSVKVLAIAPELEGAFDLITVLADEMVISIAHTSADFETAVKAFRKGAKHATHLYNAMSPFTHRTPNAVGAILDTPGVTAELVCDGLHLHPAAVRIAMRLLGLVRTVIVSDSMMATGLGDGTYDLGGLAVNVVGKEARLVKGGNIASSVSNLMDCLRVAVRDVGMPLADAARCASTNPARALGVEGELGRISKGLLADLVLLDGNLNIKEVFVRGRRLTPGDACEK